jgi:hypothetical protein
MLLHVNDRSTVSDLQDRFSDCFPLLKIEFFHTLQNWQQNIPYTLYLSSDTVIGTIRKKHNSGVLDIKSWFKTSRVEKDFRERFDLLIQIFRNENDKWILITATDDLTLKEQTEKAQKSATTDCHTLNEPEEEEEYY